MESEAVTTAASRLDSAAIGDLAAREQVRHVVAAYARAVDRLDWPLLRGCYHPDDFDDHGVVSGTVDAVVKHLSEKLPAFESTFHMIGNLTMDTARAQAGEIAAETYCVARHHYTNATGPMVLETGVRYVDRFTDRGTGYLIEHRLVVLDWVHNVAAPDRWAFSGQFRRGTRTGEEPADPSGGFLPCGPRITPPHPQDTDRRAPHDD